MTTKRETFYKKALRDALVAAGASVSFIEPNIGSTPGVPDVTVAWGLRDFWVETKVEGKRPINSIYVWKELLRAEQRKWIIDRCSVSSDSLTSIFVVVFNPGITDEVYIYRYSAFGGSAKSGALTTYFVAKTVQEVVEHFSRFCEVLL